MNSELNQIRGAHALFEDFLKTQSYVSKNQIELMKENESLKKEREKLRKVEAGEYVKEFLMQDRVIDDLKQRLAQYEEWQDWPPKEEHKTQEKYWVLWQWVDRKPETLFLEIQWNEQGEILLSRKCHNIYHQFFHEPVDGVFLSNAKFLAYCGPFKAPEVKV